MAAEPTVTPPSAIPPLSWRRQASRWLGYYVGYLLLVKPLLVWGLAIAGPWGPPLVATLPSGQTLTLQCRRYGRETEEILVSKIEGHATRHIINAIHALDLWHATIRYDDEHRLAWVESRSAIVACLDLQSGRFYAEGGPYPPTAKFGAGSVLAKGCTRHFWELLLPL